MRYFWYSNRNFKDKEIFGEINIKDVWKGSLMGGFRLINRFNRNNSQLYTEYYRKIRKNWWGYITGNISPGADFLPMYGLGGGVFRSFGRYELGSGLRYMKFKSSEVFLIVPSTIIYLPRNFYHTASLYLNLQRSTFSFLNRLAYKSNKVTGFASISFGTSSEKLQAGEDFTKYSTLSASVELEYRISRRISLGGSIYMEEREGLYKRYGAEVYGRLWW